MVKGLKSCHMRCNSKNGEYLVWKRKNLEEHESYLKLSEGLSREGWVGFVRHKRAELGLIGSCGLI